MKIGRTMFWFKDGREAFYSLTEDFFGLATLLNKLLNEKYSGKRIQFINIDFATARTYELFPVLPKDQPYYYKTQLRYYGLFDKDNFLKLDKESQAMFIWSKVYEYLSKAAKLIKNESLFEATAYAYEKGIEINLNTDYPVLTKKVMISGNEVEASLWIFFRDDAMYSSFRVTKNGKIIFEKNIDKGGKSVEFFLEMYTAIDFDGSGFIIRGKHDVENLPLKIPLTEINI